MSLRSIEADFRKKLLDERAQIVNSSRQLTDALKRVGSFSIAAVAQDVRTGRIMTVFLTWLCSTWRM